MRILIENDIMKIVFTEKSDLPFVVEAELDAENSAFVGSWQEKQHENALANDDVLHLLLKSSDGKTLGFLIIRGLTNKNDNIELMRIVVTHKGMGYGKLAISLIKKWCFEVQKTHRLWLDVVEHNRRAQHVYEDAGFIREGMLRECEKYGTEYKSLVIMSILSHEY